jgi:hypothetical protein
MERDRTRAGHHLSVDINYLYEFLFENNSEAWFLNAIKEIPSYSPHSLKEFILKIHTGESISKATPQMNWIQRRAYGQDILKFLAQSLISIQDLDLAVSDREKINLMQRTLELEGYVYRNNILWVPEETVIEEAEEQGVLESLISSLKLPNVQTLKHHLDLSVIDYQESRWDDSISNSRKVLEGILSQVASRFNSTIENNELTSKILQRPFEVREYLERSGILDKKEKEAIAAIYGLLSNTGGHPNIAGRDQARLMRHLALTFSQFVLLRLDGIIKTNSK